MLVGIYGVEAEVLLNSIFTPLILAIVLLAFIIIILEHSKRVAIENIRASTYNAVSIYYMSKAGKLCKGNPRCLSRAGERIMSGIVDQIERSVVEPIDLESEE